MFRQESSEQFGVGSAIGTSDLKPKWLVIKYKNNVALLDLVTYQVVTETYAAVVNHLSANEVRTLVHNIPGAYSQYSFGDFSFFPRGLSLDLAAVNTQE